MDGYAVRAEDLAKVPVRLRVTDDIAAGHPPTRALGAGTAMRIMTGAYRAGRAPTRSCRSSSPTAAPTS